MDIGSGEAVVEDGNFVQDTVEIRLHAQGNGGLGTWQVT